MSVFMTLLYLYPIHGLFFTKPAVFRPEFMSWFFDPGLGLDSSYYTNLNQPVNNAMLIVITLLLYSYLTLFILRRKVVQNSGKLSKTQKAVLLQASIICFFHSITSFLYVYMQFLYSPQWLRVVAEIGWQTCTGSACVVYLTLNRSLRTQVIKMVFPKSWKIEKRVSQVFII
uniref:Serpentine receptor class gamma n=1 Tax=Caenorhabditis japonica TaxID=281687 RepID=A0A8R1E711_CAEJA